ncbi:MAG: CRISPR-associated protein [Ignavibacteriales bacterium CG_4_9_14_3_um_filter_30_11]|nr:MAG: CRISPR-associated protein [Ignavibacteriales bacterium CG_4_9_14_3_um_filter_30_11]
MLINLSNHPSDNWSDLQIKTANELYGKVVDIDFPQIPPEADEDLIAALANDYKDICLDVISSSNDKNNAIHIMGELTFCFALVRELKKLNITCVASTTNRMLTESKGLKLSEFSFVRFRMY